MNRSIAPTHQFEIGRWLMACRFEVLLNAGRPSQGGDAAIEALNRIEHLEHILSVYLPNSDVSNLNRFAFHKPQTVCNDIANLLKIAFDVHQMTLGAFDVTAASLTEAWGFARRQGAMPTSSQIADALKQIGMDKIMLDSENRSVQYRTEGIKINTGGIGKGYALDRAADILERHQVDDYLIHGGHSSILAKGDRHDLQRQDGWVIAVSHPEQPKYVLGSLVLRNKALGTSGPANQFFYYNGVRYGHIIDPRNGWPAQGMLSITVLHSSAAYADALATGLFVLGPDQAIAFCQQHPEVSCLIVLPTSRQSEVEVVTCNLDEETWKKT